MLLFEYHPLHNGLIYSENVGRINNRLQNTEPAFPRLTRLTEIFCGSATVRDRNKREGRNEGSPDVEPVKARKRATAGSDKGHNTDSPT